MFRLWIRFLAAGCYLAGFACCVSFLMPAIFLRYVRTVHPEGPAAVEIFSLEVLISILVGWFFFCLGAVLHVLGRIGASTERQKASTP